jgi:hypothetical protein
MQVHEDNRGHTHCTDTDSSGGDDAQLNKLGHQHDADWYSLRMASHNDQICAANVVHPVEEQFPQILDPLADLALSFQSHLLDLAVLAAVAVCPPSDPFCAVISELD